MRIKVKKNLVSNVNKVLMIFEFSLEIKIRNYILYTMNFVILFSVICFFFHFIYSCCYNMYVLLANKEFIQRSTLSCETESSKLYLCKHVFMY